MSQLTTPQQAAAESGCSRINSRMLQRKCACGQHADGGECAECRQKKQRIQRKSSSKVNSSTVPPIVNEVLRSSGQPLGATTRSFMESRFGQDLTRVRLRTAASPMRDGLANADNAFEREADKVADGFTRTTSRSFPSIQSIPDFSGVQIHTGAKAAASARAINATAYTVGNHLVFDEGRYSPGTQIGQWLLAHELSHVVQQQAAPVNAATIQRQSGGAPPAADGGLTQEMLEQIARRLREAMAGLGTDEEAIFSAFSGRTQQQADAIARVYAELFGQPLIDDLRDELSDTDLLKLGLFSPGSVPGAQGTDAEQANSLGDAVARQLNEAMQGGGTDEASILSALAGRTQAERETIRQAYIRLTKRELEADLRDELSGSELAEALQLLNQGMLKPEDEIYLAINGLGTDEDRIYRVLNSLAGDAAGLTALEQNYRAKYGDLIQDLRGDLSAEEYAIIRPTLVPTLLDADAEDCSDQDRILVRQAHATATTMLRNAVTRSSNSSDPAVQGAALSHFKITLPAATDADRINWARVRIALQSMVSADTEVTYECDPQSFFEGFCSSGVIAVTLGNIHLCPPFRSARYNNEQRAGILLHEWGHKFGTGVNRVFETYCHEGSYAATTAEERITLPDAYAQFVRELSAGFTMSCSSIH